MALLLQLAGLLLDLRLSLKSQLLRFPFLEGIWWSLPVRSSSYFVIWKIISKTLRSSTWEAVVQTLFCSLFPWFFLCHNSCCVTLHVLNESQEFIFVINNLFFPSWQLVNCLNGKMVGIKDSVTYDNDKFSSDTLALLISLPMCTLASGYIHITTRYQCTHWYFWCQCTHWYTNVHIGIARTLVPA